ncbi:polyprenyl synthetase family protein [bacterium]|nr:MAG: polyprenyl synthetase family protein [bacterium]
MSVSNTSQTIFLSQAEVRLDDIRRPIKKEIENFHRFFSNELKTDVKLLQYIIKYLLKTKGKELRPMLVFLSAGTIGSISNRANVAATMVELMHTATLVHDDVVDDADRRRGFLSINKIWKNKAGVLLGDFLLARGLLVALNNNEFEVLKVLSSTVQRMSEGELRQLKAAKLQNMTRERYFDIISGKTASLISACCECGAIAAGATDEQRETMKEIGELAGLAFQIRDDLFEYGIDDVGKPIGNDIIEGKITLPLIEAFGLAGEKRTNQIRKVFKKSRKSAQEIAEIQAFVTESGGLEEAKKTMFEIAEKAYNKLEMFGESPYKKAFEDLIQFAVTRKK